MMTTLLADIAGADSSVAGELVIKIIGSIFAGVALLMGGRLIGRKESQLVRLKNDPLNVATSEHDPISRHEFNLHRTANESRFVALETNQLRGQDNVERKHIELLETIERAARTGVDGRVALWNELRDQGKEIAKVSAHTNVAQHLAKLTEVLRLNPTRRTNG